jgi:hypothetical protein
MPRPAWRLDARSAEWRAKELHRDARSFRWLNDLRQDTRFAVPRSCAHRVHRGRRRHPRARHRRHTAIFSVVHAVLLDRCRIPVLIGLSGSPQFTRRWERHQNVCRSGELSGSRGPSVPLSDLSNLGTRRPGGCHAERTREAVHLNGVRISPQVMAMLEATPLMGRLLEPREEAAGLTGSRSSVTPCGSAVRC